MSWQAVAVVVTAAFFTIALLGVAGWLYVVSRLMRGFKELDKQIDRE